MVNKSLILTAMNWTKTHESQLIKNWIVVGIVWPAVMKKFRRVINVVR